MFVFTKVDDESQELYNKMIVNDSIIDLHTRENDDLRLKNYELKDEMDEIEQERERCLETIVQAKDILKLILVSKTLPKIFITAKHVLNVF